jgi:hypothetical protein
MPSVRRSRSVCAEPGCPTITTSSRCPTHHLADYGPSHRKARARWQRTINIHGAVCARCGHPIPPGTPWHLDHNDDRTTYLGPSHPHCNSAAHT